MRSVDVLISQSSVTLDGQPLSHSLPVNSLHALLGPPDRIIAAGEPAPAGHRNTYVHFYDELGINLVEHHYTYQIDVINVILNIAEAIHPTLIPFTGRLQMGAIRIVSGDLEKVLAQSGIQFICQLAGTWFGEVQSATNNGNRISIAVGVQGRMLASGRRSKKKEIHSVSIGLVHDPWDTTYRPRG